jgi:large subunit ribosomal protein L15
MASRLKPEEVGLHSLRPKPGSRRARKRVGRGEGSGLGKTSGRGQKGAGARSGNKRKPGYEGGQNPIHMRTRKLRGPHRKMSMPFEPFRTRTQPVNLADLEARFEAGDEVTPETLRAAGLAKRRHPVKVLARGELTKRLTVRVHAFSAAARAAIEEAGGTCEVMAAGTSGNSAPGGADEGGGEVAVAASHPAATSASQPAQGAEGDRSSGEAGRGREAEDVGGVAPEQPAE